MGRKRNRTKKVGQMGVADSNPSMADLRARIDKMGMDIKVSQLMLNQ
jgi:hypothetical protein